MKQLNKELAKANNLVSVSNFEAIPERILQFGEGNFLRAFIDWMIDEMNQKTSFKGRVVVVQPIENGLVDMLAEQDNLYTLYLRGVQNGKTYNEHRVISAISRGINPYKDYKKYIENAHNPELRFIVSNTTEAGIAYIPEAKPTDKCPITFPAKLTVLLFERFNHFKGATNKGLIIIPCELIEKNGANLKNAVLKYTEEWKLGEAFTKWLNSANTFLSTLVDRVVSGYPRDEISNIQQKLGYEDKLLDVGEYFHLLVIEGDKKFAKELPFTDAGLNVIWTDDMTPYRSRKVKILNGAHTTTSLAGYLAGLETVREYTEDNVLGKYLEKGLFEELVPTVDLPDAERKEFAAAVVERFKNPFVKHLCLSISLNSVSKYKVRVLPSLLELIEKTGKVPPVLSFGLAALIIFYHITKRIDGKSFGVTQDGREYQIQDDADILDSFEKYWADYSSPADIPALTEKVLSNTHFWNKDLSKVSGLKSAIDEHIKRILTSDIQTAIKAIL